MTKKEKFEKAMEWLENASINWDNITKMGVAGIILAPTVKEQIDNAIKYLRNEEVNDNVW